MRAAGTPAAPDADAADARPAVALYCRPRGGGVSAPPPTSPVSMPPWLASRLADRTPPEPDRADMPVAVPGKGGYSPRSANASSLPALLRPATATASPTRQVAAAAVSLSFPPPHTDAPPATGALPRHVPFPHSVMPTQPLRDVCVRAGAPPGEFGLECLTLALRRLAARIAVPQPALLPREGPSPWLAVCDHLDSYGDAADQAWEAVRATLTEGMRGPQAGWDAPRLLRRVLGALTKVRPSLRRQLRTLGDACDAAFARAPARRESAHDKRTWEERHLEEMKARATHGLAVRAAIERTAKIYQAVLIRAVFASWRAWSRQTRVETVAQRNRQTLQEFRATAKHSMVRQEASNRAEQAEMRQQADRLKDQLETCKQESERRLLERERINASLKDSLEQAELELAAETRRLEALQKQLDGAGLNVTDLQRQISSLQNMLFHATQVDMTCGLPRAQGKWEYHEQLLREGLIEAAESAPDGTSALLGWAASCAKNVLKTSLPRMRRQLEAMLRAPGDPSPAATFGAAPSAAIRQLTLCMVTLASCAPNYVGSGDVQGFLTAVDPVDKANRVLGAAAAAGVTACGKTSMSPSQLASDHSSVLRVHLLRQIAGRVLGMQAAHPWYESPPPKPPHVYDPHTMDTQEFIARVAEARKHRRTCVEVWDSVNESAFRDMVAAAAEPSGGAGATAELTDADAAHIPLFCEASQELITAVGGTQDDRDAVNTALREHYRTLRDAFLSFAMTGLVRVEDTTAIAMTRPELEKLWKEAGCDWMVGDAGVLDSAWGAWVRGKMPTATLAAADFTEVLVRAAAGALERVPGKLRQLSDAAPETLSDAVAALLNGIKRAELVSTAAFREQLRQPRCLEAVDRVRPALRKVFKHYGTSGRDDSVLLHLKDFRTMLLEAKTFGDGFGNLQAQHLFVRMQTVLTTSMDFTTFVDSLCAVAVWKEPSPYLPTEVRLRHFFENSFIPEIGGKVRLAGRGRTGTVAGSMRRRAAPGATPDPQQLGARARSVRQTRARGMSAGGGRRPSSMGGHALGAPQGQVTLSAPDHPLRRAAVPAELDMGLLADRVSEEGEAEEEEEVPAVESVLSPDEPLAEQD